MFGGKSKQSVDFDRKYYVNFCFLSSRLFYCFY